MKIHYIIKILENLIDEMTFKTVFVFFILHMSVSYGLLSLSGELNITESINTFLYYYVVSLSTVGYGDYSPETQMGYAVVAIWLIPSGLLCYSALFAKVIAFLTDLRSRKINGRIMIKDKEHILILGWSNQTKHLISLILADSSKYGDKNIVLGVAEENIKHPFPDCDRVKFVKIDSYTDDEELAKLKIKDANFIIVHTGSDDTNFTICIHIAPLNRNAHISTYFEDPTRATALNRVNDNIEASCDRVAEILQKSMLDNGSSVVITRLMDPTNGATTYVTEHEFNNPLTVRELRQHFLDKYEATFIGFASDTNGRTLKLAPCSDTKLTGKLFIHYISHQRIVDFRIS